MKLTIIADDRLVVIDGEALANIDLSSLDPSIHAVQFYGEFGEVEYRPVFSNGAIVKPQNRAFIDVTEFQSAIDAFNAEKARLAAEAEAAAAAKAEQATVTGAQTL